MKLYKLKTIKYLIKTIGFYIVKPDGKRLHDVYPVTIVKELNRLQRRIKELEMQVYEMLADGCYKETHE